MNKLIVGLVIFFGVHSVSMLALDWRNRLAKRLGTRTWQALYSAVSLVGFFLIVSGYAAARPGAAVLYATPHEFRYVAAVLMLPFFPLLLASVFSGRIQARAQHPLLLSAMLWAVAHLLTNGSVADLLLFGTFLAWAILVRFSIARRPARRRIALPASATNDVIVVVGGLALYAAFILWLHARWIGVPALG
ncbi:MAG: NnrU family protein [Steroidobacteraceae bacterium]